MARADVIHLNRLVDEVRKSVDAAGPDGLDLGGAPEMVMLKDPRIIGFVMPIDKLRGKNVVQLAEVATRIGDSAGGLGGLIVNDGDIIVGFLPPMETFRAVGR